MSSAVTRPRAGSGHDRLAELRALRGPAVENLTWQVRRLVVVVSSSRGGSSMVTELLRSTPALLHLSAEFNPFLRIAELDFPASGTGSDALDAGHADRLDPVNRQILDRELALDAGVPAETIDDDETFARDAAWRFFIQWPEHQMDVEEWTGIALRVLRDLRARHGWAPGELRDAGRFQLDVLAALPARAVPVNPRYYDLPEDLVRDAPAPAGPPGRTLIEEPPFVLPRPWRRATAADLASRALVIKAPSNAYRMDFLRALFPYARIQVLHLTRNPAAAINGLYDGWLYPGFHAHRMPEGLGIDGYAPHSPEERHWWKFDLPPDWHGMSGRSLIDVCAFQWRSCHQAILADRTAGSPDYLRVRFEDVIRDPESRARVFARVADWLDIPLDAEFARTVHSGIGPVVATAPPSPRRWRRRIRLIRSSLDRGVLTVAGELGYESEDEWI